MGFLSLHSSLLNSSEMTLRIHIYHPLQASHPICLPAVDTLRSLIKWVVLLATEYIQSAYPTEGKLNNLIYGVPVLWIAWIIWPT